MTIRKKIIKLILPISHTIKEKIWRFKWFNLINSTGNFVGFISCIDGKLWHGGMCDRFKGIVSTYAFCKEQNIPFRIHYTYPFKLETFLVPNTYDWLLKENEFSENIVNTRVLYLVGESSIKRFHKPKYSQIHVYANRDVTKYIVNAEWGSLFKELFKPSPLLRKKLEEYNIQNYIALVFRFQNLIGDFKEYNFKPLSNEQQHKILNKCKAAVLNMCLKYPDHNILVTSDSSTFLKIVKDIERVKIIPGEIVHMDSEDITECDEVHLKSFLDFYMISNAEKVYCIGTKDMYPSEFPMYAAKINNVPFKRITI